MNDQDYALKWAKKIRAVRMLGGRCQRCGESDVFVLDFHHPGDKENAVRELLSKQRRWKEVEREVSRCELMCSNCHMEHHHPGNGRSSELKASVLVMLGKPSCSVCGQPRSNPSSLDFHHSGSDKEFHVSDVFARKRSVGLKALLDEIAKCKIVCRNCHARMRVDVGRFRRLGDIIERKVESHREEQKPDVSKIVGMARQGLRVTDISRALGYAKSKVRTILKRSMVGS